jgi:hypothetical protein
MFRPASREGRAMDGDRRVIVSERFCGPPGAGNGGYVAGLFAGCLDARIEVTLRRPTPLETPLALRVGEDGWRLQTEADGTLLASGRSVEPPISQPALPPSPGFERASAASANAPRHPFPRCFVCGPARGEGDGLRIFSGPVRHGNFDLVAAPWIPGAALCADGEHVDASFLWSALDCPGAIAAMADRPRPMLLARMTADVSGRVRRGERCVLIGWRIARDGRKHRCGTALYGEDGDLHGASEQLWIEPRAAA